MNKQLPDYDRLSQTSLAGEELDPGIYLDILTSQNYDVVHLLNEAYKVRRHYWGDAVKIHVINNAQNGNCPEDCAYCAQAKTATTDIADYKMKSEEEILAEAKQAYESGAFRYCMVFSGRGPRKPRVKKLAEIIRKIKNQYPLEVCLSPGLIDDEDAQLLKEAGLNRFNHNLNTSEEFYPQICTTHTFQDRLTTLGAAKKAGIELCSGVIAGLGETPEDLIKVAFKLRQLKAESIPVNFLIPVPGTRLENTNRLTPQYCLRILCVFRFLNPSTELRVSAGREYHLRSLQPLALMAANSLFMDGYLNTKGTNPVETIQMITDAGFTIDSEVPVETIIEKYNSSSPEKATKDNTNTTDIILKQLTDLRPAYKQV